MQKVILSVSPALPTTLGANYPLPDRSPSPRCWSIWGLISLLYSGADHLLTSPVYLPTDEQQQLQHRPDLTPTHEPGGHRAVTPGPPVAPAGADPGEPEAGRGPHQGYRPPARTGTLYTWLPLPGRLARWLTDLLADWLTDWLTCCLIDWLTGWLIDWHTGWLADWLTSSLISCLSVCQFILIEYINRLVDLTDSLCLSVCLADRLAYCLFVCVCLTA